MIKEIRLKNFKAFKDEFVDLAPLSLLAGMNGIGKSSVIQTLLLLRQSFRVGSLQNNKGLTLRGEYLDLGKGKDIQNINAKKDEIEINLKWIRAEQRFRFGFIPNAEILPFLEPLGEMDGTRDIVPVTGLKRIFGYEDFALFNKKFQYLSADRHPPKAFFPASTTMVESENALGIRGEYTAHYLSINQRESIPIPEMIDPDGKSDTLLDQLTVWLSRFSPGIRVSSRLYNELDIASVNYQFETSDDLTPEFSPVNVGFGMTYVLPVVTAVLAAEKGSLLIIENPEAHLHPQGQAVLGKLFAKAAACGIQIIVETHSDHILNAVCVAVKKKIIKPQDLSILYFERDWDAPEHVTTVVRPQVDENGRLDRHPEGFFDEYDKQMDELLEP